MRRCSVEKHDKSRASDSASAMNGNSHSSARSAARSTLPPRYAASARARAAKKDSSSAKWASSHTLARSWFPSSITTCWAHVPKATKRARRHRESRVPVQIEAPSRSGLQQTPAVPRREASRFRRGGALGRAPRARWKTAPVGPPSPLVFETTWRTLAWLQSLRGRTPSGVWFSRLFFLLDHLLHREQAIAQAGTPARSAGTVSRAEPGDCARPLAARRCCVLRGRAQQRGRWRQFPDLSLPCLHRLPTPCRQRDIDRRGLAWRRRERHRLPTGTRQRARTPHSAGHRQRHRRPFRCVGCHWNSTKPLQRDFAVVVTRCVVGLHLR